MLTVALRPRVEGELRGCDPATGELLDRHIRVGPLATVYVRAGAEPAAVLPSYSLSNPPYEIRIYSPGGDWILWFGEGGMFWDLGRRVSEVAGEQRDGPLADPASGGVP